jgi:hypothetical protein
MYPATCSEFLFRFCDGKVETEIRTHRKKRKKEDTSVPCMRSGRKKGLRGGIHKIAEVAYPQNGSSNMGDARRLGAEQKIDCAATCHFGVETLAAGQRKMILQPFQSQ